MNLRRSTVLSLGLSVLGCDGSDFEGAGSTGNEEQIGQSSVVEQTHEYTWEDDRSGADEATVLLHRSYPSELSKEEIDARWAEDVAQYKAENQNYKVRSVWFEVTTVTGNHGTNGRVEGKIWWSADFKSERTSWFRFNNSSGQFGSGRTTRWLVEDSRIGAISPWNYSISWTDVRLKGTDNWSMREFKVDFHSFDHDATGCRQIGTTAIEICEPKVLDNNSSVGWDYGGGCIRSSSGAVVCDP